MRSFATGAQANLEELLKEMSNELSPQKTDEFYGLLVQIYDNDQLRHSYARITKLVVGMLSNKKEDSVTCILQNLNCIQEKMEEERQTNTSLYVQVGKLSDHINLEVYRYNYYKNTAGEAEYLVNQMQIAKEQLQKSYEDCEFRNDIDLLKSQRNELSDKANEAKELVKNLNLQLVSVLGIFAAVIVSFFGGFSYFTSVFSNISGDPEKLMLLASLVGFVVFNLIVFLISSISFIINKPIPIISKNAERKTQKTFYQNVFIIVNVVLIIAIAFSTFLLFK